LGSKLRLFISTVVTFSLSSIDQTGPAARRKVPKTATW
jgi:hypothetical protein